MGGGGEGFFSNENSRRPTGRDYSSGKMCVAFVRARVPEPRAVLVVRGDRGRRPGGGGWDRARPGGPRARRTGDRRRVSRGRFRATPRGARARGVPDARGDAAGGWRGNGRGADDGTCRRETTGSGDGAREAVPVPGGGDAGPERAAIARGASRSRRGRRAPYRRRRARASSRRRGGGGGSRRAPVPSRSRFVPPRAGAERGVRAPNARGGREPGEGKTGAAGEARAGKGGGCDERRVGRGARRRQ